MSTEETLGFRATVPEQEGGPLGSMSPRTAKRLLIRGNTAAGVAAAVLDLLAAGREIPVEEIEDTSARLRAWAADVRAMSSEDHPGGDRA